MSPGSRTEMLERRADVVRARLLRAVVALEARRHEAARVGERAKAVAGPAVLAAVGVVALFGASAWMFRVARRRRRHGLAERAAVRIRELDLVGRPSLARRAASEVTLVLLGLATKELARRGARMLAEMSDGRIGQK